MNYKIFLLYTFIVPTMYSSQSQNNNNLDDLRKSFQEVSHKVEQRISSLQENVSCMDTKLSKINVRLSSVEQQLSTNYATSTSFTEFKKTIYELFDYERNERRKEIFLLHKKLEEKVGLTEAFAAFLQNEKIIPMQDKMDEIEKKIDSVGGLVKHLENELESSSKHTLAQQILGLDFLVRQLTRRIDNFEKLQNPDYKNAALADLFDRDSASSSVFNSPRNKNGTAASTPQQENLTSPHKTRYFPLIFDNNLLARTSASSSVFNSPNSANATLAFPPQQKSLTFPQQKKLKRDKSFQSLENANDDC